jgi:hypothetical protein
MIERKSRMILCHFKRSKESLPHYEKMRQESATIKTLLHAQARVDSA